MTAKFNRDTILKNCFFDLGVQERKKLLQSWLSNVVTAAELTTEAEAMKALMAVKRKPFEPAGKLGLHHMHATFFVGREQQARKQPEEKPTDEKKSGPEKP